MLPSWVGPFLWGIFQNYPATSIYISLLRMQTHWLSSDYRGQKRNRLTLLSLAITKKVKSHCRAVNRHACHPVKPLGPQAFVDQCCTEIRGPRSENEVNPCFIVSIPIKTLKLMPKMKESAMDSWVLISTKFQIWLNCVILFLHQSPWRLLAH